MISKKTGLPQVATVVGFIHPVWLKNWVLNGKTEYWDSLYPEWEKRHCVMVAFDEPSRPLTKEEYLRAHPDAGPGDYEVVPEYQNAYYPIDDLEIL